MRQTDCRICHVRVEVTEKEAYTKSPGYIIIYIINNQAKNRILNPYNKKGTSSYKKSTKTASEFPNYIDDDMYQIFCKLLTTRNLWMVSIKDVHPFSLREIQTESIYGV